MLREERTTAENETLRNYTVQIKQLEAKARLKETTRLEYEEIVKRQWNKKQKEHKLEIHKLKEMSKRMDEMSEEEERQREEKWKKLLR